jgi:tetratricopeptide (TPR) repeat protein
LSLYKKGRFEEARISAQTASQRAQGRMKASLQSLAKMIFTFTKVWREAKKSGLRNPPYTIQKLKTAIHLDKKISKGHFKTSLSNLLVGCFVHYAQNSLKRGKYSLAYQNASQALRYNPYNPKAKAILANLERYAEKLYKQGYSVRKSDPARAKKLWEKVLKIVPPSSIWYQRAEDRLTNI